ncbi:MAG: hypothetical protein QNJ44_19255 [Rhodobacter sp.]|nr:hypothetical protein [Rhodobacter sp.]
MIRATVFVSRHFTAFACLAYLIAWGERLAEMILHTGPLWQLRSNSLTQYFVSYPDHGFAKRALLGTVFRPLLQAVEQPELWAFWMMVGMNVLGFAGAIWLARKVLPHDETGNLPTILRAAFAVGSVGVVQIAHDYGRFDLPNYFILAGALWLVLQGRAWAAGAACAAGILIHEAFAVYAAPLAVALAWQSNPPERRAAAAAQVALAAGIATLAVLLYGSSSSAAMLQIGTGAYVWQRGLIEIGWDLPWYQVAVLAGYWAILLALLVRTSHAREPRFDPIWMAALSPLALNLLGIDHGRWVTIGFVILTASLVLQVRQSGGRWPELSTRQLRVAGLLALPLGPHGVTGAWTWIF